MTFVAKAYLRQKLMKLLPFSGSKSSVHGGADVDNSTVLGELGSDQLGLDDVDQEHLHVLLPNLDAALDLLECYFTPETLSYQLVFLILFTYKSL